ncbi:D-inositol-3-phosphate glycosyltransferase [anaerobic digester metagenome]
MKIAVICPNFKESNLNKQPWKYIYEISKYLKKQGQDVFIITDSDENSDEIKIITVKKLFVPFKGETQEVLDILIQEKPDKCVMLLGLTSFLRKEFKIEQPVHGIFTSPLYSLGELLNNIGIKDSFKYRRYTSIHYINAMIPKIFVKKWTKKFENIIFLSDYTRKKLVEKGFNPEKAILIPSGIDEEFLIQPEKRSVEKIRRQINPENVPIIMYFTSPLTLRGTDTLVKAFGKVRKEKPCKLIFLSRIDYKELKDEEKILRKIAEENGVLDSLEIISEYLTREDLKKYLSAADMICLPFKIVISDVPVSILEAMALGKPVVSTNVACIPELLNGNGITVEPNNSLELAKSISNLLSDNKLSEDLANKNRKHTERYPIWETSIENFFKIIQ